MNSTQKKMRPLFLSWEVKIWLIQKRNLSSQEKNKDGNGFWSSWNIPDVLHKKS